MKGLCYAVKVGLPLLALAGCATTPPGAVTFAPEMPVISSEAYLYDLRVPEEERDWGESMLEQSYALLGREDLTARTSDEYRPAACASLERGAIGEDAVLDAIVAQAATARVVIVNESHLVTRHRAFTASLAQRLRPLGYTYFAAEAFANRDDVDPPIVAGADLPYPRDVEGHYVSEAAFARLVRDVKRLGFTLVPYEHTHGRYPDLSVAENIALREAAQAQALADTLAAAGPDARMLVHVGYDHARETPKPLGEGRVDTWMAARFKALTGEDPVTVSQYECRSEGGPMRLSGGGRDSPEGAFDFVVDHPVPRFAGHRPLWREAAGDVRVPVPATLVPAEGAHVVEARLAGEPDEAVPMDRVLVFAGESVDLLLPPGHYRLRAVRALTD